MARENFWEHVCDQRLMTRENFWEHVCDQRLMTREKLISDHQ